MKFFLRGGSILTIAWKIQRFNANLDEIATIFDNYKNTQQQRRSQVNIQPDYFALAGNDAETQLMQRLREAQAERDYWQRRARYVR